MTKRKASDYQPASQTSAASINSTKPQKKRIRIFDPRVFSNCLHQNHHWRDKLINDFDMGEALEELREILSVSSIASLPYENIYQTLLRLKNHKEFLPFYLRYSYENKNNYLYLLVCCLDIPDLFFQIIPKEEWELWKSVSLFLGMEFIPKTMLQYAIDEATFEQSMQLDALGFEESPDFHTILALFLNEAASAGRDDLVLYGLDIRKQAPRASDFELLYHAARSGNEQLYSYLLTLFEKTHSSLKESEKSIILNQSTQKRLDENIQRNPSPTINVPMLKRVLDSKLVPSQETLRSILCSENLSLVRDLLSPELGHFLPLDDIIIDKNLQIQNHSLLLLAYNYVHFRQIIGYLIPKNKWKRIHTERQIGEDPVISSAINAFFKAPADFLARVQHLLMHPEEFKLDPKELLNEFYSCFTVFEEIFKDRMVFKHYLNAFEVLLLIERSKQLIMYKNEYDLKPQDLKALNDISEILNSLLKNKQILKNYGDLVKSIEYYESKYIEEIVGCCSIQ